MTSLPATRGDPVFNRGGCDFVPPQGGGLPRLRRDAGVRSRTPTSWQLSAPSRSLGSRGRLTAPGSPVAAWRPRRVEASVVFVLAELGIAQRLGQHRAPLVVGATRERIVDEADSVLVLDPGLHAVCIGQGGGLRSSLRTFCGVFLGCEVRRAARRRYRRHVHRHGSRNGRQAPHAQGAYHACPAGRRRAHRRAHHPRRRASGILRHRRVRARHHARHQRGDRAARARAPHWSRPRGSATCSISPTRAATTSTT